jgi:hypothetical protein
MEYFAKLSDQNTFELIQNQWLRISLLPNVAKTELGRLKCKKIFLQLLRAELKRAAKLISFIQSLKYIFLKLI